MALLSRCALSGIPASGSPVEDTTLPVSSDGPSAASDALDATTAQAAVMASAETAIPNVSLAFIVVTFLRWGRDAGRISDYCRLEVIRIRPPLGGFNGAS